MSSSGRATAARMPAEPIGRETGHGLAGLIDVLDRADGGSARARSSTRRPVTYRPAGSRAGAVRAVPLRSVQPAPMARPVPGAVRPPEAPRLPAPAAGRLHTVIRRAALWGAGPRGEHLAWRPTARAATSHTPAPARSAVAPRSAPPAVPPRPARLRRLVRRVALWGAGPAGEYLAWGAGSRPTARPQARPAPKPVADRPVVLREMPSTPTIQPVAPSPAAALSPHGPASTGPRWMPPVPRGAVAVPGVRPRGRPERSQATGWPSQDPSSGVPTGLVRARGDPLSSPARGSPAPARRSRSPGSVRSSFP
jgi:hypothetical protein